MMLGCLINQDWDWWSQEINSPNVWLGRCEAQTGWPVSVHRDLSMTNKAICRTITLLWIDALYHLPFQVALPFGGHQSHPLRARRVVPMCWLAYIVCRDIPCRRLKGETAAHGCPTTKHEIVISTQSKDGLEQKRAWVAWDAGLKIVLFYMSSWIYACCLG
jgi:hypothetical protein